MTDQEEFPVETPVEVKTPPRRWRWVSLLLKVIFIILAILLIGIVVMANMGGSSDSLKESVEGFIREGTGYDPKIENFNSMKFFPEISFDFEHTTLLSKGGIEPVIYVDKTLAVFSFWDVMASNGKIKAFDIRGVKAVPGALLNVPVIIDSLAIVDSDEGPSLEGKGSINEKPVSLSATMKKFGSGKSAKFTFGKERDFNIMLGEIKLTGKMTSKEKGSLSIENLVATLADKKIFSGQIDLNRDNERILIGGRIDMEQHHTDLVPAIEIILAKEKKPTRIKGSITSNAFHIEDFNAGSGYDLLMSAITGIFGELPPVPENEINLDAGSVYNGPLPLKGWRIDTDTIAKAAP